eukprot:2571951-Alexandrium_andersonii.AAC.1
MCIRDRDCFLLSFALQLDGPLLCPAAAAGHPGRRRTTVVYNGGAWGPYWQRFSASPLSLIHISEPTRLALI